MELAPLRGADFDARARLESLFKANEGLLGSRQKLDAVKWDLQQLSVQRAAEFEAKALMLSDSRDTMHRDWQKQVCDQLHTLMEKYRAASEKLHRRLDEDEGAVFQRVMDLEQRRSRLNALKAVVGEEAEWRRSVAAFEAALAQHDLDGAQGLLESLDEQCGLMKRHGAQLDALRDRLVALIRML